jgi:hypothetical protein
MGQEADTGARQGPLATAADAACIDHLVIAADTLEAGVAWCEANFGVTLAPGGKHPLFGTHNRLLRVHGASNARLYLEVIAVDPSATPERKPPLKRWFDLDDPVLRGRLRTQGPQLIHWVARVPDLLRAVAALEDLGVDRGRVMTASRPTPHGLLSWQIAVRDDGQRLFDGVLPTLIQWGDHHPALTLPDAGVSLESFTLSHPNADGLRGALAAVGLAIVKVEVGEARLRATLNTPAGLLTL